VGNGLLRRTTNCATHKIRDASIICALHHFPVDRLWQFRETRDNALRSWRVSNRKSAVREFKKYPNRRLYDLTDSHYVTVDDVRRMILGGESIRVSDSKDGADITRSILLQILAEQEAAGHEPVLTNRAIEQIIRFYGNNAGNIVSRYIEQSILTFFEHQDQFRKRLREMSDLNPFSFMRQAIERAFVDPRRPPARSADQSGRTTDTKGAPPQSAETTGES
jgi:polyhydroxyalkanoate synthesis repressor PhaR